jgi:hypothetical protein
MMIRNYANCESELIKPEKKDSPFNYIIIDDLWDFVSSPYQNILSHHSIFIWTIPTIILFTFDDHLTQFYLNEIESRVRYGREKGYIFPLNDHFIFSTLKSLHIYNASYLNNDKLYRFSYSTSEAIVDSYFVAQSIKMITGRARPVLSNKGPYSWFSPTLDPFGANTSFPSLHATYYFSVSTILGKSIDNEILGDVVGLTAFLCVVDHNHWISDIWIGYLLGKSIGYYVWHKNKNIDLHEKWWVHLEIHPKFENSHPFICLSKVF